MTVPTQRDLDQYRNYLHALATLHMGRELRGKSEPADLVQQTLLLAHAQIGQFRGTTEKELLAWLRVILANCLATLGRALGRAKRDTGREQSLEAMLDLSSQRLDNWLTADQSSPSQRAMRRENSVRIAEALAQLPEGQREALLLRYCQGLTFTEIAERMELAPSSVAGLLARGSRQLRQLLETLE